MDINEYAKRIEPLAQYPDALEGTASALCYTALGLAGEAGEVANQIKKILRDDAGQLTEARREGLKSELGDVAWYFAMLCRELNLEPASVLEQNVDKLFGRKARGTLLGDGDQR